MSVDLHEVNCPGCGAPMDGHLCPSSSVGGTTTVVREYVRGTGPRKAATAHPTCPHCGGRIHFNMGATAINAECLWRIYLVATSSFKPMDKLPPMYLSNMLEMAQWYEARIKAGSIFDYGKHGGGTYSSRRKTPASVPPSIAAPVGPPASATMPPIVPNPVVPLSTPPTKEDLRAKRRELLKARSK